MPSRAELLTRTYSVYFLRDPRSNKLVYIGISSAPRKRLVHHKCSSTSPRLRDLICELKKQGLDISMQVALTGLTREQALRVEMRLCFLHFQVSYNSLFNAPVHCTKTKSSVCAIGPRNDFYAMDTIECGGCGERLRFPKKHRSRHVGTVFSDGGVFVFCRPCMSEQIWGATA